MLALLFSVPVWAADPRVGSWTLVSAQCALDPPNKLSITDVHESVHIVMSGEKRVDFMVSGIGHKSTVPGNPAFNQVTLHRIDKRHAEVREMKDGSLVATVAQRLSADGDELTITTSSAGHADQITVWTRSGGAKTSHNLFAGDWVQDLSKTRLRQGSPLEIEADGNDGVRFSGEFSYVAHFDGRAYDVRNSRNDTVTLQLVDPHTVDAIYRRDDQVTQKDRWVVSADGQQMTVTTTATYESGQHLSEKLVFKKR